MVISNTIFEGAVGSETIDCKMNFGLLLECDCSLKVYLVILPWIVTSYFADSRFYIDEVEDTSG